MLDDKVIWITRPLGQAEALIISLENRGALVEHLPMLAIEPLPVDATIRNTVLNLDSYQLLFFISTNAATIGMDVIHDYWPQFPVQLKIYAVGPTTAAVLESFDLPVEFPRSRMSSEVLLELESLQDIQDMKALVVRGVGGRELLATALNERGASVDYLELYRRTCPPYPAGTLAARYKAAPPDGVVITSAEALENFRVLLVCNDMQPEQLPLFVSSERIAQIAQASGFKKTVTMRGADDKAIIDSLGENLQSPKETVS